MTTWFKALIVLVLLASFLLVQADLPLAQAAAERAVVAGEKCVPHRCCCSREKRESGTCCCTSAARTSAGDVFRAAGCAGAQPPGDTPVVVKFQVTLPWLRPECIPQAASESIISSSANALARFIEPPDPPPRIPVSV